MIEDKLIDYGNGIHFRFFHVRRGAFERQPIPHCHPEFEISYFLEGEGEYLSCGRYYEIKPGCAFLYASNEQHIIIRIKQGTNLHMLCLHFSREFLAPEYDSIGNKYFRFFIDRNSEFSNCMEPESPCAIKIRDTMLEIEKTLDFEDSEIYLAVRPQLEILLNDLRLFYHLKPEVPPSQTLALIAPIYKYIHDNLQNNITLDELADLVHVSRSYLSTMFRRATGTTVWQYIQAERINHAASLIIENRLSITEIAFLSGFNNISNFNRTFRRVLGTTPSKFKARNVSSS